MGLRSLHPVTVSSSRILQHRVTDTVRCFECNVEFRNCQATVNLMRVHRNCTPRCRFVMSTNKLRVTGRPKVLPDLSILTRDHRAIENEQVKQLPDWQRSNICFNAETNAIYIPCNHVFSCLECAVRCNNCPVCREAIQAFERAWKA